MNGVLGRLGGLRRWESALVLLVIVSVLGSALVSPTAFSPSYLLDMLTPYIYLYVMALGLMFVIIVGEIDISVISTMVLSAAVFSQLYAAGVAVPLCVVIALLLSAALGTVNGVLVAVVRLPSLAVTLGTMAAYRGLSYVLLGGAVRSKFPSGLSQIGGGYVAGIVPIALLVLLGIAALLALALHTTRFGRYFFSIGQNSAAAYGSGIPVSRYKIIAFALAGLTAGIASVIYFGYFGSIEADSASGSELVDVITVIVFGGVSIFGGSGSVVGVILAAVFIASLRDGMQLADVSGSVQGIVVGSLLVVVTSLRGGLGWVAALRKLLRRVSTGDGSARSGRAIRRQIESSNGLEPGRAEPTKL